MTLYIDVLTMHKRTSSVADAGRVEDYLTTIYRLEEALGIARTTDISRELGVTPATVSKVIKKLEEKNFVKRVRYKYVTLTDDGRKLAEQIIRKHRISEVFLVKILGFNDVEAHMYAHYLEHLPDVVIERAFEVIGKPSMCPHGNPIPGVERYKEELETLSTADIHQKCVVQRIAGEFVNILTYLHSLGIRIGSSITITRRGQRYVFVELENGSSIELPIYIARYIYVKCF